MQRDCSAWRDEPQRFSDRIQHLRKCAEDQADEIEWTRAQENLEECIY